MHLFLKFIFEIKLCRFQTVPLSIISNFSLYTQQWYMSYRFADSSQAAYAASSVLYTTSCKHGLLLLRMGEIITRNMLS